MRCKTRQLPRVYLARVREVGREERNFHLGGNRWHSPSRINLLVIKLGGRAGERKRNRYGETGGGRKGDRKRNREMNLFMDGAGSSGDGRAGGGINAKLAIHTKSAWVQVKRGEYISPGINLFELGLHWNNWTLQRAMISECSCGRREREGDGEGGRYIDLPAASRTREGPRDDKGGR